MSEVAIKIKYVNQPKKVDGKYGNIKSDDGSTYFIPVSALGKYRAGMEFMAPVAPAKWGQDVVQIIPAHFDPGGSPAAPQTAAPAAPQQSAPPTGHNSARMSDPKDMLIFVTGIVGRAMGSGQFGVTDISLLTQAALAAYKANLA